MKLSGIRRKRALAVLAASALVAALGMATTQANAADPRETLRAWHEMALELTRHTAT